MIKKIYLLHLHFFTNGPVHIGHIAGAYLPADMQYLKQKGYDVAFICGSDEYGAAITLQAKKEGLTPQKITQISLY